MREPMIAGANSAAHRPRRRGHQEDRMAESVRLEGTGGLQALRIHSVDLARPREGKALLKAAEPLLCITSRQLPPMDAGHARTLWPSCSFSLSFDF